VIQERRRWAQRMPRGWLSSFSQGWKNCAPIGPSIAPGNQIWPKQSGSNSTSSGRKRLRDRFDWIES